MSNATLSEFYLFWLLGPPTKTAEKLKKRSRVSVNRKRTHRLMGGARWLEEDWLRRGQINWARRSKYIPVDNQQIVLDKYFQVHKDLLGIDNFALISRSMVQNFWPVLFTAISDLGCQRINKRFFTAKKAQIWSLIILTYRSPTTYYSKHNHGD